MKTAWKLCLALALMVAALFVVSVPAFAAEGPYTVSGTVSNLEVVDKTDSEGKGIEPYTDGPSFDGKKVTLYRVGGFARKDDGTSYLKLDKTYFPAGLANLEIAKGDDEEAWTIEWLGQAQIVANHLATLETKPESKEDTIENGTFSFTQLENGLYLLIGNSVEQIDGDKKYVWSPCPMFVMVLNGDVTDLGLKVERKPVVEKHKVQKQWSDDGHEDARPDSVMIQIWFQPTGDAAAKQFGDPVELKKEDSYAYDWETDWVNGSFFVVEKMEDQTDESMKHNYYLSDYVETYTDDEEVQWIKITNNYRHKLEIVKEMPTFVLHPGDVTTTFAFEITGYDGETPVYHTFVGAQFAQGETSKKLEVADIPCGLSRLAVKEIYSGAYQSNPAEDDAVLTLSEDKKISTYKISFENTFNTTNYSSGIINRYSKSADAGDFGYTVEQIDFFHKKD